MATGCCPFFSPFTSSFISALGSKKGTSDRVESGVERRKKKEENTFSLPSPQIRVALEMTEMEWSNPLGLTSKAGGFRAKIRTTARESESFVPLQTSLIEEIV